MFISANRAGNYSLSESFYSNNIVNESSIKENGIPMRTMGFTQHILDAVSYTKTPDAVRD